MMDEATFLQGVAIYFHALWIVVRSLLVGAGVALIVLGPATWVLKVLGCRLIDRHYDEKQRIIAEERDHWDERFQANLGLPPRRSSGL
jgi:hypothetical protein